MVLEWNFVKFYYDYADRMDNFNFTFMIFAYV